MHPVWQRNCGEVPAPACICCRSTEKLRAVVDGHRAVCDRAAGQCDDCRVGDAIADHARIRRERGNGRHSWRSRNCNGQGRRRRPGIAGRIGRGRCQVVQPVRSAAVV